MAKILLIEDNAKMQAHVASLLRDEGHDVMPLAGAEEAHTFLSRTPPRPVDLMLLDVRLGGMSGLELITRLGTKHLPPTIVISGEATISEAIEALRLGVLDFIEKPFTVDRLTISVRNCLEKLALRKQVRDLEQQLAQGQIILGESPAIAQLNDQIEKVARTEARVLITGESGTGKELVASTLHRLSRRSDGPFVRINCASFPVHLIEDELFGHVRGAFTDARQDKIGLFEEAHGGTLFLDEIGDMEFTLQSRLLRVLEDGRIRRIGDTRDRQVDVRVIAATNRNLEQILGENRFREDLFYRLSTVPLVVPALRERSTDIPLLVNYYVSHFCRLHQSRQRIIDREVFDVLTRHNWPGNVRELRNLCERLVIFGGDPITLEDLPSHIFHGTEQPQPGFLRISEIQPMPLRTFKTLCEKEYLDAILRRLNWNYVKVAESLEINRSYLHQKITALGIDRRPRHQDDPPT